MSTPALADLWYEHYLKGEEALKAQNWKEAVQQFTHAIEKKGDPGVGVRTYGMNFINYHPYLKLGMAYMNLGQYDAALQAFDTEEKLGAIAKSAEQRSLAQGRLDSLKAKESLRATEEKRISGIVAKGLEDARRFEAAGDLDAAVAALGSGLAVDPKNPEVLSVQKRLQEKIAARENERELESRLARLIGEGKDLMASGKYQEASSVLNQALAVIPENPEARTLLAESQSKLRAQIRPGEDAAVRQALVTDGLAEVARLEKGGQLADALARLQSVLAVEPGNRDARAMQERLARAQSEVEQKKFRAEEVSRLLQEGEDHFKSGQYDRSLASFNRGLALDPGNAGALGFIAKVYAEMNQRLLGTGPRVSLPPFVILTDLRNAKDERESPEQRVSAPDFVLSGTVVHNQSPVTIALLDGRDRTVHEMTLNMAKFGDTYVSGFVENHHLSPGRTNLKVVAKDLQGLTFKSEYQVYYHQPFVRSRLFYVGLTLLGMGTAGGFVGYRVRRRNRLLKRRFNPYVAGAPVLDDDLFVGREPLLSRILETIHNNSILLYGERRIGKTSLQHHLKRRLQQVKDPGYDFYPVYIDLQGTPEERFFATLADDIFAELSPVLDGSASRRLAPAGAPYDYNVFIREVHQVLGGLRKRSAKKVKLILLIDEVDELNNYDPRINQKLRSLFMKSFAEDLVAVVSGVGIKKHWASEGSPWYNFFEEIEVRPFTREDAKELIKRPIRGIFRLEEGVVDRIIENTECRPYLIQKMCVALVNRMHDERRRRITLADVEAIGRPMAA